MVSRVWRNWQVICCWDQSWSKSQFSQQNQFVFFISGHVKCHVSSMAVNCLSRSCASLVLILLLATLLHLSYEPQKLISDENVFVALKLNATLFPGRKSGLPRHSTGLASLPSWKLQASFYLANITLSACNLVLLAGDVSSITPAL